MNKTLKIIALIVATALITFFAQKFWPVKKSVPTINYGQLQKDNTMSLVKQTNEYSDFDGTYKWRLLGTTWIRCTWKATSRYGIKIPKDWDWKIKYDDRTVSLVSPKLELIDVNLTPSECKKVKNGAFVNDTEFRNKKEKEFQEQSEIKAEELLKSEDLKLMAKLSLESQLLNILNQANPELDLLKINVEFIE